MDLTKLSDEELMQLLEQQEEVPQKPNLPTQEDIYQVNEEANNTQQNAPIPQQSSDLSQLSDEELQAMLQQDSEDLGAPPEPTQEMHPDISFADRAIIKNFSQSPKVSQMYLTKKYPNADVKLSKDGQIMFKRKNEKEYKVLDPSGFDWQDLTDVGFDVASGIGEGASTIAGGMLGAGAGPVGAVAGGVAAGGAAAGASEALRQKLGQALGLPQEIDSGDVATSAGFGAGGTLLFGPGGKVGKEAAKNTLTSNLKRMGVNDINEKNLLEKINRVAKNIGVSVGQTLEQGAQAIANSGILFGATKGATKSAAKIFNKTDKEILERSVRPELAPLRETIINDGYQKYANDVLFNADQAIANKLKQDGEAIGTMLRNSGKQIDVTPVVKQIDDEIAKMSSKSLAQKDKQKLEALSKLKKEVFEREMPDGSIVDLSQNPFVDADEAYRIKDILADNADFFEISGTDKASFYTKDLGKFSSKAYGQIKEQILKVIPEGSDLNKSFRQTHKDFETFKKYFRDNKKVSGDMLPDADAYSMKGAPTLRSIGFDSKENLKPFVQKLEADYGVPLYTEAKNIAAAELQRTGGFTPISKGGTTSTTLTLSAAGLGAGLGGALGQATGESGGGRFGAALGAPAGVFLLSPKALRSSLKSQQAAQQLFSPWTRATTTNILKNEQE